MKFASGSGHKHDHDEDQVQNQDLRERAKKICSHCGRGRVSLSSRKRIRKALQFVIAKKTKVDDASCKTLSGEVADSTVDSEDRSPDGRIIDVLAQQHDEDAIKEFGDAAKNGYETANEEVV
ncbi:hypothetical protein K7X08_000306 [Anisodus acutangulus]|uniref:Uncharacterized protein n=1 Tax=Anisodus acutangulus TaxID=402998 RepID=A0A9Q1M6H3_9SOLA|nr:hypothetical protein K7X08_000306 [Anisodus acutangulus]